MQGNRPTANHVFGKWTMLHAVPAALVIAIFLLGVGCGLASPTAPTTQNQAAPAPTSPALSTQPPTQPSATQVPAQTAVPTRASAAVVPTLPPTNPVKPTAAAPVAQQSGNRSVPSDAALFAGAWRAYSARLYYDAGGGGALGATGYGGQDISLTADGGWQFSSSSGHWSVGPIVDTDWQRWGVKPYGPTRKITWQGWNGSTADGPIEESAGSIDFLWVIYKVGPPTVEAPGTAYLKYGHQ